MEEDLKTIIKIKAILLSILTILISISVLFFIGVVKVFAVQKYPNNFTLYYYRGSTEQTNKTCTDSNSCESSLIWGTGGNPNFKWILNETTGKDTNNTLSMHLYADLFDSENNKEIKIDKSKITVTLRQTSDNSTESILDHCNITVGTPSTVSVNYGAIKRYGSRNNIYVECTNLVTTKTYNKIDIVLTNTPTTFGGNSIAYLGGRLGIDNVVKYWEQIEPDATVEALNQAGNKIANEMRTQTNRILGNLEEIINNNQWENQSWTGISSSTSSPNTTDYTNLNMHETLINQAYGVNGSEVDHLLPDIGLNGNASEMIWYMIQNVMNNKILTMLLTVLFLGVIATLFNR